MKRIMCRFGIPLLSIVLIILAAAWCAPVLAQSPAGPKSKLDDLEVLDLETAARMALADNPSLKAAMERAIQAREAVRQARSAYWPRLDLEGSGARVTLSNTAYDNQWIQAQFFQNLGGPPADVEETEDYYKASLTASWLLFDGFARWFNLAAAKSGEQSSRAAREDARRLLLSAVIGSFLNAQLALENVSIAKADEAFNQRLLSESKLRYDVGTGALSDVLNFEVQANSANAERIAADRVYQTSRIGLAALLGIAQARLPEKTRLSELSPATEVELATPDAEALLQAAYNRRPDLRLSDYSVQQAEALAKSARSGYWPTLMVSGSYDGERVEDAGFESEDFGNTIALSLQYNLFSGGLTHAKHQEAKARLRELERTRENARINITSEVQSVLARVGSAQQQLLLQRRNAKLVHRNRDLVEKEYKAGVGSLVRLNEAQRDLIRAQVRLASARATLRGAWYDLETATGQIVETFK
jgi:TolC family type I secretion outer membrane protein